MTYEQKLTISFQTNKRRDENHQRIKRKKNLSAFYWHLISIFHIFISFVINNHFSSSFELNMMKFFLFFFVCPFFYIFIRKKGYFPDDNWFLIFFFYCSIRLLFILSNSKLFSLLQRYTEIEKCHRNQKKKN